MNDRPRAKLIELSARSVLRFSETLSGFMRFCWRLAPIAAARDRSRRLFFATSS